MSTPVHDPTALSQLFHLNSEPWLNEAAYRGVPFAQEFRTYSDAERVPLPGSKADYIRKLAVGRRSVRAFHPGPLALTTLAAMLRAGYGVHGPDVMDGGGQFLRRPVPSAGGLYPLEIYALIQRVEGVNPGIYHFDALGEAMELLRPGNWRDAAATIFYTWPFVDQAPVILCLAAMFGRTQKKYGPRGYRYVLLEAGHVAQNLCLAAAEHGLSTLCMGGYRDGALNQLLGLTVPDEGVVYTIGLGQAALGKHRG
jgi:SagB-type dehydrogenase family enzyme